MALIKNTLWLILVFSAFVSQAFDKSNIKAVILNTSGAVVDIDVTRWEPAFRALGARYPERLKEDLSDETKRLYIDQFESGELSKEMFINLTSRHLGLQTTDAEFITAWNTPIQSIAEQMINDIQGFKKLGLPVFALANTNTLHSDAIEALYAAHYPDQGPFYKIFNHHYWSFETGVCQPDALAWLQITQAHGLEPSDCLYIDTDPIILSKAQNLGFKVLLYDKKRLSLKQFINQ